jgi:hypothetical protein
MRTPKLPLSARILKWVLLGLAATLLVVKAVAFVQARIASDMPSHAKHAVLNGSLVVAGCLARRSKGWQV